ncbi:MAG: hypothetical protein H6739_12445, partial [Alphaproteobacteria bacterium]|nr:hypothetical protein [Alphaproteobacteria bacterium]
MTRRWLALVAFAALLVAGGWFARAERAMLLRARLPGMAEMAVDTLAAAPGCDHRPAVASEALLALVLRDLDDPGCANDGRVVALLATAPHLERWLERLLRVRRGTERGRLRVSLALIERSGELHDAVREELGRGRLSPRSREILVDALVDRLGPEALDAVLGDGAPPRYDAGHSLAAWRLAEGDPSAVPAVRAALARERLRPTLATSAEDPGLSRRKAQLTQAALAGLGLDAARIAAVQDRRARGLPLYQLPPPLSAALADTTERCDDVT